MTDKQSVKQKYFAKYYLQTPHLEYLQRTHQEKHIIQDTNPQMHGHALSALCRNIPETLFLESKSHLKVLDVGGSLTRNPTLPTFNLVMSQKDLVRGLQQENMAKMQIREVCYRQEKIAELHYEIDRLEQDLLPLLEPDWAQQLQIIDDELQGQANLYQLEINKLEEEMANLEQPIVAKTIYRRRHYNSLKGKFDWLLFNHSAYDMTPAQIATYMVHFGTKKATAFINRWAPDTSIFCKTLHCGMRYTSTGTPLYAQWDDNNTSYYAHTNDPRFYATPGTYHHSLSGKTLSWEVRTCREDTFEIEFSLTRTLSKELIMESTTTYAHEQYYQVAYVNPQTNKIELHKCRYQMPSYFQNRINTLMIREFIGKWPSRWQVHCAAEKFTAEENRKILLTDNNRSLSVNMNINELFDATVQIEVEFMDYINKSRTAGADSFLIFKWFAWLASWFMPSSWLNNLFHLLQFYNYLETEYDARTNFYNISKHTRAITPMNINHSEKVLASIDPEETINKYWAKWVLDCPTDNAVYGKLLSHMPSRDALTTKLIDIYENKTGCKFPSLEYKKMKKNRSGHYVMPTLILVGTILLTVSFPSNQRQTHSYKLQKAINAEILNQRPINDHVNYTPFTSILFEHEKIAVQQPPAHFKNVDQFSIKNIKGSVESWVLDGFASTKTFGASTLDFLNNLVARNDLRNNESTRILDSASKLHRNLGYPKFSFATPHEYYARWMANKPTSEHAQLEKDLEEFKNSLTDSSIFLKTEHLFKKYGELGFVKAHTITHFDKVANCILTMFVDDFKAQLAALTKKFNIFYTDGTPTFEIKHDTLKEDEMYFESDLTAQDAKQGTATVLEFIEFYDLVGAPKELTTMLFTTYTQVARNGGTGLKINNGVIKPTGGPDTGTNNYLNNLFLSQDLLFSHNHRYSQILGDDLKAVLLKTTPINIYIDQMNSMGTECKPELREAAEFCSSVSYQAGDQVKLVPKTEKIINMLKSNYETYRNGLISFDQMKSTVLNVATQYSMLPVAQRVTQLIKGNNEYNRAKTALFNLPSELYAAASALAESSVYSKSVDFQVGLFGTIEQHMNTFIDEFWLGYEHELAKIENREPNFDEEMWKRYDYAIYKLHNKV